MAYGQDAPIRIWAWGTFVEIANKAIELYRENIDASVTFEVEELMPQEICDRLSNYSNKSELPNIILVFDQEIKKYLKDFNGMFSVIDDQIDLSVYTSCKIANITHKDHIYGYPLMSEPIALYYNKNTLEEYREHELQDDITWNEFIEIGKALKQQGIYLLPPANYLTRILMQSTGQLYYDIDGYISAEGSREVMELIERLNNDGLLYPDSSLSSDILYNLMANGEIFSIPGTPHSFSAIKQSVQETGEEQEWDLTQLPKSNAFQFNVDLGGCSWLIVNKEEIDDQEAVFDFLMRIFNQENESSRALIYEMSETYDLVPAVNSYARGILDTLTNNGCFVDKQVIKYLSEISETVPEIYYGKYTADITQSLNEIVAKIIFEQKSIDDGFDDFENICIHYEELDPPPVLLRIEIDQEPDQTDYYKYECFLRAGMVVHAYYTDGTDEIVTDYSYLPNQLTLDDSQVTVSYTSGRVTKTATQPITISDRTMISISVSTNQTFLQNDLINPSSFVVRANYNEGSSRIVTASFIDPSVLRSLGETEITIYYDEDDDSAVETITIMVYKKLESIIVSDKPKKISYYKGERFNRDGMSIMAHYSDGTTDVVTSSGYLKISPEIVKFEDGKDTTALTISYTENGITEKTFLTVYKKTGADFEDCNITQDMSESGIGTVNLSTGKLTYTFNDFTGYDAVIPISISHVYKDGIGDGFCMGNNWRLNLQQELFKTGGKWQYTNEEGKEYLFDDGYDSSNERSAIRNEKLGLDLFKSDENDVINLVDRNNNTLVFTLISGKHRLTAMHMFPSTANSPCEDYSLEITYLTDGKISSVTAGKSVSGKRPMVQFIYSSGCLSELRYIFSEQSVIAQYGYNGINLDRITLLDKKAENAYTHSTQFRYEEKRFTVCNLSSKNTSDAAKALIYSLDSIYRVIRYTIGYGDTERDETEISYTATEVSTEENSDISLSTVVENKGTVSVVAFNSMGLVSQYDYEITDASHKVPKRVSSAQSRGFSYKSLSETYSDTLDVYHDDFENGTDSWSGATKTSARAISGESCISGTALSKSYRLTSSDIANDTTIYFSLWASTNVNTSAISIKITLDGSKSGEFTHKLDKYLSDKWQFTAFCLGKRKIGDIITVELSCESKTVYIDDVRLTKSPYETPEELADTTYDKFGNVTKSYQYNPIDGSVETTEYEYNSAHQITQQTLTAGNAQKNSIVNTYSNGFFTYKKEYGKSDSLFTQEQYIYTNNAMTSLIDVNNVVTKYKDGMNYAETIIVGEANSPDTNQKKERFPNSRVTQTLASGNLKNSYIYSTNGRLQKARFNYSSSVYISEFLFEYDTFGNLNAFKIGTIPIVTMEYDYKHLNKTTYANGDYISHTYDAKDRVIAVAENGMEVVSVIYGDNAEDLVTITHSNGLTYTSKDIGKNGLTGEYCARFSDTSRILRAVGYAANGTGNVTAVGYFVDDSETPFEKRTMTKDSNGLLTKIERINHGAKNTYLYDDLYRMSGKVTTYVTGSTDKEYKTEYGYNYFSGRREGTRITKERHYNGSTWKNYFYDYYKNGNIKKVSLESDIQNEYSYDAYGRLVRENNYALSRSYKFTYDNGGNIIKKETYLITGGTIANAPTKTDSYNYETITSGYGQNAAWKDQLKSYNGTAIRYDEIGNPLNYLGKVMTWRGRKLTSVDGTTMDYDYNGLRIRKGNKTYYWQGSNLIMERWVKNGAESYIYYYYDESGVCGMNYNGTEYYYRKNILGDVIAIYDSLGNLQCRYVYDAWGNHKVYNASGGEIGAEVLNIGNVNSIRYRGYYWDKEFNLYYLQSRYYDPALGRFISADDVSYLDPESIMGFNLYSYCGNNPIFYIDPEGNSVLAILLFMAATTIIGGIIGALTAASEDKKGWDFAKDVILGAALGLAVGGAIVSVISVVAGVAHGIGAMVFGHVAVKQAFAIGALGVDFTAYVIAPLYGFEMEGIELEPTESPYKPPKLESLPPHPYTKGKKGRS